MPNLRLLFVASQRGDKPSSSDTTEKEKEEKSRDRFCYARSEHTCRIWHPYASLISDSSI